MLSYKPINGWSKRKMITYLKKVFKGKSTVFGKSTSYNPSGCVYFGEAGKRCAVGMFIPLTDKYKNEIGRGPDNNLSVETLLERYPELQNRMPLELDGLFQLQSIHDESKPDETLNSLITWIKDYVHD